MIASSICNIVGTLVGYLNNSLIYCNITNHKFRFKILYFLLIIALSVFNVLVILKLPVIVKVIYNLICLFISLFTIKKDSFKSILYYVFILWLFGVLIDIICSIALLPVFTFILKKWPVFGMLLLTVFVQIILNLVFRIKKIKSLVIKFKNKLDMVKNVIWIFSIMIFIVILFGFFAYKRNASLSSSSLFLMMLVISIMLSFFLIKVLSDEKEFKRTIIHLLDNNSYYIKENKENSVFRHNIIHELNSLKTVANDKTSKLIDDIIKKNKLANNNNKNEEVLPNGINGLISKSIYSKENSKCNIVINNYLESDLFNVLSPRRYNKLCETLGICLDNAISASLLSKEKILHICILEDETSISIKISNTFKDELEIDKLGTANYTTKKDGHGLGLYSMTGKRGVKVKSSIVNNLFENQIIVKKVKNPT